MIKDILYRLNEKAPSLHAFADAHNCRWPRIWGQGGERPDAWQEDWNQDKVGTLWCNPPFTDLLEVIKKVDNDQAHIILIAPEWPEFDYFAPMGTHCSKYYHYPEGTRMFELDGIPVGLTHWAVWALVLDAKRKEDLKQQALPKKNAMVKKKMEKTVGGQSKNGRTGRRTILRCRCPNEVRSAGVLLWESY